MSTRIKRGYDIVLYGTSLTTGRLSGQWDRKLAQALAARTDRPVRVHSMGKGSQTSDWGVLNMINNVAVFNPTHILFEGFSINDSYQIINPVWDSYGSNIVITDGGLSVTKTADSWNTARSTGRSTGKLYYEIKFVTGANVVAGIGNAAASLNQYLGSNPDYGIGYYNTSITNVGAPHTGYPNFVAGETCQIAVDIDNRLIWFKLVSAASWSNGLGDPATGTGGLNISSITSTLYPLVSVYNSTSKATANFGGSTFEGTIPSGFRSWNSAAVPRLEHIANITNMVNTWRSYNPNVDLTIQTMNPVAPSIASGRPDLALFYQDDRNLATTLNLRLLDNYLSWPNPLPETGITDNNDGLHPTEAAVNQYLLPNIIEHFVPLILTAPTT